MTTLKHTDLRIDPHATYTPTDEWMRRDGNEFVIGITDYAQAAMRNMMDDEHLQSVYIFGSLKVGDIVEADEVIGEIHSSKTVSDIHCPVSGVITAINGVTEYGEHIIPSGSVETDPYGAGWLIRIHPGNVVRTQCDAAGYAAQSAAAYIAHFGG